MKKMLLATAAILFSATTAMITDVWAAPHTYQVTGEVLEIDNSKIVISKGKDNWELARDAKTKVPASVKIGSKITIEYSMMAIDVTDKTSSKKTKADKAGAPAPGSK